MEQEAVRVIVKIKKDAELDEVIQAARKFTRKPEPQPDSKPIRSILLFEDFVEDEAEVPNEQIEIGKTYVLELPGNPNLDDVLDHLEQMDIIIYAQEDQAAGLY